MVCGACSSVSTIKRFIVYSLNEWVDAEHFLLDYSILPYYCVYVYLIIKFSELAVIINFVAMSAFEVVGLH